MSLKCGIVGLPNVGNPPYFNALTWAAICGRKLSVLHDRAQRPASLKSPNPRLAALAAIARPEKVIAATVESLTSPDWSPAQQGAKVWAPVPRNIRECDADRAHRALL